MLSSTVSFVLSTVRHLAEFKSFAVTFFSSFFMFHTSGCLWHVIKYSFYETLEPIWICDERWHFLFTGTVKLSQTRFVFMQFAQSNNNKWTKACKASLGRQLQLCWCYCTPMDKHCNINNNCPPSKKGNMCTLTFTAVVFNLKAYAVASLLSVAVHSSISVLLTI